MYPNQQPGQWQPQPASQQQPQPQQLQPLPGGFDGTYLDTIAAPVPTKTVNPLLLWGMIGGLLLIVTIFFTMLLSSNGGAPSNSQRLHSFIERTQALKKLTTTSAKNINSSSLRASNSSLSTILSGVETETSAHISALGMETPKKSNKIPSKTANDYETIAKNLDDARLNVAFDRVYAREVTNQIAQLRSEMSVIYKNTRSADYKTKLAAKDIDLKKLGEDFANFNS